MGSQTAIWGTSVTLSVNATGFGTLSYQWYKNNVAITGGTQSSYTISSAVTADAANYTVKVTDPYGATTSSIYVLTVTPPTHLDLWRQTYFPGSTATSGSGADSATPLYDGVSNLMKFATGMDPTQPGLRPGTIDVSGTDLLFTYTPSAGAVADGFTFTVEYSDTLGIGSWFSDIVDQGIIGSGGAPVTATLPQGSGPRRFLRLKINKP